MSNNNLTIEFTVKQTPEEVFNAVNNVRGWWSTVLEGASHQLNDEFTYRHKDIHYSKHRLTEVIPGKKVVWRTTDSDLSFTNKTDEWTGTDISFEISVRDGQTHLLFTHHGLTPQLECFNACSGGWNYYINQSLLPLIATGKGQPD